MRQMWLTIVASWLVFPALAAADDAPPRSLDPRLKIELFAEEPQLVTPTGIDVDHRGRVWVIESNTHFPPEGYKGHPTDRLLVMSDADGDGKADRIVVFTDGLKQAMSVALRPLWFPPSAELSGRDKELKKEEGVESKSNPRPAEISSNPAVYVATRREIVLFHDDDGDDKADRQEQIVHLETKGVYPHNGLAGITFDAIGWIYFGFGENEGADYKIIGSDGTTLTGGGEGGSLYRCRLDGSKLERWATGFWNPFASCFDAFGRLFTVDNDADSRPPCRLLHIIKDGDYGYRYRNGRKGLHPFTSWNGEIPGTLPMVAGTGEAPSGILAYESDGLPEEYIGNLLVTSWGDHRIDRFRIKPKGASFESLAEPLIVGGENFRPVGIACAPDGSLYCSDWVLREYKVHGRGRIWRISATKPEPHAVVDAITITTERPISELTKGLQSSRLDIRRANAAALRQSGAGRGQLVTTLQDGKVATRSRIEALWSIAQVPMDVQSVFKELPELWSDLLLYDEVSPATYELIGSPQFDVDSYLAWNRKRDHRPTSTQTAPPGWSAENQETVDLFASLPLAKHFTTGGPIMTFSALRQNDPFLFGRVISGMLERPKVIEYGLDRYANEFGKEKDEAFESANAAYNLAIFVAGRRFGSGNTPQKRLIEILSVATRDLDAAVRRTALQWIAEDRLKELRPQVEAVFNDPAITADLFLATLAAIEMLDGVPPAEFDKTPPGKYVLPLVVDEKRPASVRALALRMVDPNDPALGDTVLSKLLASDDLPLKLEALRTLLLCTVKRPLSPYARLVSDDAVPVELRAEAIAGLARPGKQGKLASHTRTMVTDLLNDKSPVLQREALRSLRPFVSGDPEVKAAIEKLSKGKGAGAAWLKDEVAFALRGPGGSTPRLAGEGLRALVAESASDSDDPAAGRRAFYRLDGAGCYKCHTINGRGGRIGPDLSTIGRALSREKFIDSILEPSKEIAPQFVTWAFETTAGKVHTGMLVFENEGKTTVGDAEGNLTELKTLDIASRVPQKTSVMPEKLAERMSVQEFRDLLAFLEGLR